MYVPFLKRPFWQIGQLIFRHGIAINIFKSKIFNIIPISVPLEIITGSISSDVDKYTAINVPNCDYSTCI